jgi:serine/threonine protein kinase/tetratricopeptide (TPR) repeat protein
MRQPLVEILNPLRRIAAMSDAHWERVKEVFEAATPLCGAEREECLREACGEDAALRAEVERLLEGHDRAGDFLATPAFQLSPSGEDDPDASGAPAFSPGEVISGRFEIIRFLGRGGMGEVYEARDSDLGERVALKTIRAQISGEARSLARFKQEIQLARRVTHPNVCRIFDIERHRVASRPDGASREITFLSMELLIGETLAEAIRRHGKFSDAEALPIIRQMAAALAAAHSAGVIHRDFKPSNVMLVAASSVTPSPVPLSGPSPRGQAAAPRAVVTDFGLARLSQGQDAGTVMRTSTLTGTNQVLGTFAYMAPEQIDGGEVTPATDIYALGLVIFEMLTGALPYVGGSSSFGVFRRMKEPPPSLLAAVPDLDPAWDTAIRRSLEHQPADRFSSTSEFVAALTKTEAIAPSRAGSTRDIKKRRIGTPARVAGIAILGLATVVGLGALNSHVREAARNYFPHSSIPLRKNLVVLPFRAIDASTEEKARCEGFTDRVTATLVKAPSIEVSPAEAVREGHVSGFEEARLKLGANLVLSGSWQENGTSVIVSLVLMEVDSTPPKQLRTEIIQGDINDLPTLQDQVVFAVLRMLQVDLSPNDEQGLTVNVNTVSAYGSYVLGLGYLGQAQAPRNVDLAISQFQHALSKDRSFAQAQAALARAYRYKYIATGDRQWNDKAEASVNAAESMDSRLPEVQLAIGIENVSQGKNREAIAAFNAALESDPDNVIALQRLAFAYAAMGNTTEAEHLLKHSVEIRPDCWSCYNEMGRFFNQHARYTEAVQAWEKVLELDKDNVWGYQNLGVAYTNMGEFDLAEKYFRGGLRLTPDNPDLISDLGSVLFFQGRFEEDARLCERATQLNPQEYALWGNLGDAYRMIPTEVDKAPGAYRHALSLAHQQLALQPNDAGILADLALYSAHIGEHSHAGQYLALALKGGSKDVQIMYNACLVSLDADDKQKSLYYLKQAVQSGYPRGQLTADPQLQELRREPMFASLVSMAKTYR